MKTAQDIGPTDFAGISSQIIDKTVNYFRIAGIKARRKIAPGANVQSDIGNQ